MKAPKIPVEGADSQEDYDNEVNTPADADLTLFAVDDIDISEDGVIE